MDNKHYADWLLRFSRPLIGGPALEKVEARFPATKESEHTRLLRPLRDVVLGSCYSARIFSLGKGRGASERPAAGRPTRELSTLRNAAVRVQRFNRQHRKVSGSAFIQAILSSRSKSAGLGITVDSPCEASKLLESVLTAYLSRLEVLTGPGHSSCLVSEGPLRGAKGRPLGVETMLLFDLVQTFRLRSQGISVRQPGELLSVT